MKLTPRLIRQISLALTSLALVSLGAMIAMSAQAGAPGQSHSKYGFQILNPEPIDMIAPLSPAEIRNAMSIRMDRLAAKGIAVDRAAMDGIGLGTDRHKQVEVRFD